MTQIPRDPDYVREQTGLVVHATITDQRLEDLLPRARTDVMTRAMGALVTFEGVVRDHDSGERVESLTYSAHPQAERFLHEVASTVSSEFPDTRLWVAHRTGALNIGDLAFVVLAASAHRGSAFAAAQTMADRVKHEVPIWKEQKMMSGSTFWVGID